MGAEKKLKQWTFPYRFIRKAQNIEWILLDEDSESKWTPDDQAIGDRCIPEWIKYKNEEVTKQELT